jgi:arginase
MPGSSPLRTRNLDNQLLKRGRTTRMQKPITLIDAPSNLGLRPPAPGIVPGVYKLAGALRDQGLLTRLGARDGGVVTPPRYLPDWDGKTVRNGSALVTYSQRLADRIQHHCAAGAFPLVLGGDCSILLGAMLALRRQGHYGLVFLDGHLDFRHPGNAEAVGSAAGEDLALVTGRGGSELTNLEGLGPLVDEHDVVAIGFRTDDEYARELQQTGITAFTEAQVQQQGPTSIGQEALHQLTHQQIEGYWIHLDADILDPTLMPAVDTPTPGGLTFEELTQLLRPLLATNLTVGLEITVFDPDLDPTGELAQRLTDVLVAAFLPEAHGKDEEHT